MKNILIILIVLHITLFAQSGNKSQSIELPAFVITGIQSVSLPTIDKKKSEYVPVVGENFLTPKHDTEDFELMDNTSPIKKEMKLYSSVEHYNGLLQLGAGLQTLPIGNLDFSLGKNNFLFNTHLFGSDVQEYVPYAGYNTSGAEVKLSYFVNHRASSFPGMQINAVGGFVRDQYNFYGTSNPTMLRENERYYGELDFTNKFKKDFRYGVSLSTNSLKMKIEDIKDNVLVTDAFMEYKLSAISIGAKGLYKMQQVRGVLGDSQYDYLKGDLYLSFASSKMFSLKIGANYAFQDTNNLFSPVAILSVFVEKGVALFLSYEGNAELVTISDFLLENRYYESNTKSIFQKSSYKLSGAIKYDFSDIFEINAGFFSAKIDNYHYYEDIAGDNRFALIQINEVDQLGGFLSVLINAKKYGELFADLKFQDVRDAAGFKIPYKPLLNGNISYGYLFNFGLYSKLKLSYLSSVYTDIQNENKLSSYLDLGLYLKYNFIESLALTVDFQNIFDNNNYLLKGYKEKPLDIIVGIEYRW
jgi:hypothetical protein